MRPHLPPATLLFAALPFAMLLLATVSNVHAQATPALTTEAERSGNIRTGRYDEVIALCEQFAGRYPDAVQCIDFGTSPAGRPMKALIDTRTRARTPEQARPRGVPPTE